MSAPAPSTTSTSPPPPPPSNATSPTTSPSTNATAPTSSPPTTNSTVSPPPPPPSTNSTTTAAPAASPPPPASSSSVPSLPATSTNVGIIVGVAIGGFSVLVAVAVIYFFYRRRQRKLARANESGQQHKDDQSKEPPQTLQQKYTPPPADKVEIFSMPSTGSGYGSEKPPSAFGFSESTFTYEELAMATNGFSNQNLLGQGGFGYVHKGILPNGKVVAIKQLKIGSGQGEREFQAEVEVINRVHHRHLVSLVGYCISGAQRLLVYEFVSNSTLEFHLHGKGRPAMTWPMRMKIALGSAKGLAYLHEDCHPKIIHRDIKAANILIDENFEAKVADFGLAKLALDTDTHVSTRVMGTFGYLAPEYASSGKLSDKSDVFSFGVVLLELITGHQPIDKTHSFTDDSMVEWARPLLAQALEKGKFDGLVDARLQNDYNTSEMACMIACAAACVRHSGRRRPKMSQVVRALEGNLSPDELNEGVIPGHTMIYSSAESTQYSTQEYKQDMMKFRKLALESQELDQGISETSGPSSDFGGQNQSASSGEGQQSGQTTQDIKQGRTNKDIQDFGLSLSQRGSIHATEASPPSAEASDLANDMLDLIISIELHLGSSYAGKWVAAVKPWVPDLILALGSSHIMKQIMGEETQMCPADRIRVHFPSWLLILAKTELSDASEVRPQDDGESEPEEFPALKKLLTMIVTLLKANVSMQSVFGAIFMIGTVVGLEKKNFGLVLGLLRFVCLKLFKHDHREWGDLMLAFLQDIYPQIEREIEEECDEDGKEKLENCWSLFGCVICMKLEGCL